MSLTARDFRLICVALGFTAVVIQGKKIPGKHSARHAAYFAALIEEFCHTALPEAFKNQGEKEYAQNR